MYRVFDNKEKVWIDNVYMSPDGDLYMIKKGVFGVKLCLLSDDKFDELEDDTIDTLYDRYVVHRDIDLYDKNDVLIYQGDIVQAEVADDRVVTGLVTYANELAAYIILCYDNDEYFTLGESVVMRVEVIGNILENRELLLGDKKNGNSQQTL